LTRAEEAYKDGLRISRALAADYSSVPRYGADAGVMATYLADHWLDDNPKAAGPLYEEAIVALEKFVKKDPHALYYRIPLRNCFWGLAQIGGAGPERAVKDYQRALELDDGSQRETLREALHKTWTGWAFMLAKKGDHAAAAGQADVMAADSELPVRVLASLGGIYASNTIAAVDAKDQKAADTYAGKCVAVFLRAEKLGYLQEPGARKTLELYNSIAPLAARTDFQALLKRAQKK
jgi:hypothetical protein